MQLQLDNATNASALVEQRFCAIPRYRTLSEIIASNVTRFGSYTSLLYDTSTYSNLELLECAGRLAAGLRKSGVKPADRIVVNLPNCPEVLLCYLACSMLRATIVPTLPSLTVEELAFVLADSGAVVLIVGRAQADRIAARGVQFPGLTAFLTVGGGEENSDFRLLMETDQVLKAPSAGRPDDLAAIIYTSGTTGKPKGVMLSQQSICRQICLNYGFYVGPADDSRVATLLMPLPMSHVFGLAVTMASLLMGNLVVLMQRFDAARALTLIRENAVRIVPAVPTMLIRMADRPDAAAACRSVRQWDCGGAPLPHEVRMRVERELGGVVTDGWGLSETAGAASQEVPGVPHKPGSSGPALPGIDITVLAEDGNRCAPGEIGELLVRGETVMQGYWNRPEVTAQTLDAAGFVHTGDIGYVDADGYVYVLGRKDDLIIRGGENISPREIEETIQRHPDVADVAVVGIPDPVLGGRVCAFIIARPGQAPASASIQDFCRQHLARHKVPEAIEFLDELPRTSTGKVLKRELRKCWAAARPVDPVRSA